ncbi:MAG: nucleotidyltransferase domain-containing protein [Thermoplasmata archaeon]
MNWIGRGLSAEYWALETAFRGRPFSGKEAAELMSGTAAQRNLRLSRLTQSGWLVRIGRGRYLALGPLWVRSRSEDPLLPLRPAPFFPELALAISLTIRTFGPRLRSLALFGSAARGMQRPESDLDLLVVAESIPTSLTGRLHEFQPIVEAGTEFALEKGRSGQGVHIPQIVLMTPEELTQEPPLLLDLTQDARILFDPDRVLEETLDRLRAKLARLGSRRIRTSDGEDYWLLKPGARVGEVEEV